MRIRRMLFSMFLAWEVLPPVIQSVSQLAPHSSGVKLKPLSSPAWLALSLFRWWWHAMKHDCSGQTDGFKTSLLLCWSASHFTPLLAEQRWNQISFLFVVWSLSGKPPKRFGNFDIVFLSFSPFDVQYYWLKCGWGNCDTESTKWLTVDGMWI